MAIIECSECGKEISDQAEACPHCGAPGHGRASRRAYEYRTQQTICGLPWVHIVNGIDPATGRSPVAKGIIAIGGKAVGVVAIGGIALGGIALGGCAFGLVAAGGVAVGLLGAAGGVAIGLMAAGGLAIGYVAIGGKAIGHGLEALKLFRDFRNS